MSTFLSGAPVVGRETVKFLEVVGAGGVLVADIEMLVWLLAAPLVDRRAETRDWGRNA